MSDSSSGFNPLGMSSDMARNLLSFGAATMVGANARGPGGFLTYGSGALGPIGAGIQGMQQQQLAYSQLGSENNLRAAQAEHERASTALTQMQIPFMQQQMDMLRNLPLLGGSSPGAVPPVGEPGQSFGGNPAPIPVGQRAAMVNDAVNGTNIPPQIFGSLVDQESAWDANAVSKTGAQGLSQILPSTAKSPGFGMQGVDPQMVGAGPQNASANLKFGAQYLNSLAAQEGIQSPADWATNPEAAARTLARYNSGVPNPTADNGVYASTILARAKKGWSGISAGNAMAAPGGIGAQVAQAGNGPIPLPGSQPAPQNAPQPGMPAGNPFAGLPSPQEAYQRAQQYYSIAQRLAGAPLLAGMAKQYSDQATQLMQFALHPYELRQGGMAAIPGVGILKNPDRIEVQGPTGGETYAYATPPVQMGGQTVEPGSVTPALTDKGVPAVAKIPPPTEGGLNKAAEEFNSEAAIHQYNSAVQTIGWTQTMDNDFQELNSAGWSSTGPGAQTRMEVAAQINSGARALGLPNVFDPNKVSSWEALNKQTRLAGMQLVNSMFGGQREAASTIQSAMSSVPSINNSPLGAKLITNIIRETAQYQIDRRAFVQAQAKANQGDYLQPGLDFDQGGARLKQYMMRAISSVKPYTIKSTTPQQFFNSPEAQQYLPGTVVRTPSGNTVVVPQNAAQQ